MKIVLKLEKLLKYIDKSFDTLNKKHCERVSLDAYAGKTCRILTEIDFKIKKSIEDLKQKKRV